MVPIADLLLPIIVAPVFVFLASSIFHVLLPLHRSDYGLAPGEDEILTALRAQGIKPGTYMFPYCKDMKDLQTPEMKAKFEQGPVGHMTILTKSQASMGPSLVMWFVYSILVSLVVGYIAGLALGPGADYMRVFQITGATAFLAYGIATMPESIWKGQSWAVTGKFIFDGLVYGLVTAGAFGWLWPAS